MKKLLALAFVAVLAGGALAQPGVGIFFSDSEFTDVTTNIDIGAATPFDAYVVVINLLDELPSQTIGGYELGLTAEPDGVLLATQLEGENGLTSYGDNMNHLVGYVTPLNAVSDTRVLATLSLLMLGAGPVSISMHASSSESIPGHDGPVIADGEFPETLVACFATGGLTPGPVATVNGLGIVATESRSLSDVKALFE